jgi:hypothetical protein
MARRIIRKRRVARKSRGLLLELDNQSGLPSEFVHSLVSWCLAFLKKTGAKPQQKMELTVKSLRWRARLGKTPPIMIGKQLGQKVVVAVATDPSAYPASGRYTCYKEFPEYWISNVTDALVSVLVHEIAHWLGVEGDREGEFLCEVLSSAAVADYRARYETGRLLP